jgi:hypothetical protein
MNYKDSIRQINVAEAYYFRACDQAETDEVIDALLSRLHALKADHKAKFGVLLRVDGEWI